MRPVGARFAGLLVGPYLPFGQYARQTARRANVTGLLTGPPIFWNLEPS